MRSLRLIPLVLSGWKSSVTSLLVVCSIPTLPAGTRHLPSNASVPPAGQWAIIDTPVLVELVGPERVSVPEATIIRAAVAAGWDVIVAEHSIDELHSLLGQGDSAH